MNWPGAEYMDLRNVGAARHCRVVLESDERGVRREPAARSAAGRRNIFGGCDCNRHKCEEKLKDGRFVIYCMRTM